MCSWPAYKLQNNCKKLLSPAFWQIMSCMRCLGTWQVWHVQYTVQFSNITKVVTFHMRLLSYRLDLRHTPVWPWPYNNWHYIRSISPWPWGSTYGYKPIRPLDMDTSICVEFTCIPCKVLTSLLSLHKYFEDYTVM